MNTTKITITPTPNGPLLVKGKPSLRGAEGPIEVGETCALCRCGASRKKPFCDGSHTSVGFSDAMASDRTPDRATSHEGKQITIHDNRGVCAHSGVCTDGLPSVWRYKQEPWIAPDGDTVEKIIAIVEACPSGALSYSLRDAGDAKTAEAVTPTVQVAPKGPYAVRGDVQLEGVEFGERTNPKRFTLCRCGSSKNKPFCDGTHWNVKFDE